MHLQLSESFPPFHFDDAFVVNSDGEKIIVNWIRKFHFFIKIFLCIDKRAREIKMN